MINVVISNEHVTDQKAQVVTANCCSHVSLASTSISTFQSFLLYYFMLISFLCRHLTAYYVACFYSCRTNPLLISFLIQMVCLLQNSSICFHLILLLLLLFHAVLFLIVRFNQNVFFTQLTFACI